LNVGAGTPVAAAVIVTLPPTVTVWLTGCVVIVGAAGAPVTVRVAAVLVAVPTEFVAITE
jgi:hypothetical protein